MSDQFGSGKVAGGALLAALNLSDWRISFNKMLCLSLWLFSRPGKFVFLAARLIGDAGKNV